MELRYPMFVRRAVRFILYSIMAVVYAFVLGSLLLFHGPFPAVRQYVIDSLETTMHGYLLEPLALDTLPEKVIQSAKPHLRDIQQASTHVVRENFLHSKTTAVRIETYHGSTYTADIMFIPDPTRVRVGVTKYIGKFGMTLSEMLNYYHAIGGINGGAFQDVQHWRGTGGSPQGITIMDGKVITDQQSSNQTVIALTNEGQLITGPYTLSQLQKLHVTQALTFGPTLVQNGQGMIKNGNGGWGYAPRTVIGQKSDGTLIFIVTDGRGIHGPNDIGASLLQMQNLMLRLGAVTAANLDGGSSSTMMYNGKLVNQPTDVLGEREVATAFLIFPAGN